MTDYGSDFDPEAQFDEIDNDDWYWYKTHEILLVGDTKGVVRDDVRVKYRDLPDWDVYANDQHSLPIKPLDAETVQEVLDDPTDQYRRQNIYGWNELSHTGKAKLRLATALTERVERTDPSF